MKIKMRKWTALLLALTIVFTIVSAQVDTIGVQPEPMRTRQESVAGETQQLIEDTGAAQGEQTDTLTDVQPGNEQRNQISEDALSEGTDSIEVIIEPEAETVGQEVYEGQAEQNTDIISVPEAVYGEGPIVEIPQETIGSIGENVKRLIVKYSDVEYDNEKLKAKQFDIKKHLKEKHADKIKAIKEKKKLKSQYEILEIETDMTEEELLEELEEEIADSSVEYIQADNIMTLTSHDPHYDKQWALHRTSAQNNPEGQAEAIESDVDAKETEEEASDAAPIDPEEQAMAQMSVTREELDKLKELPELTLEEVEGVLARPVMPHELDELMRLLGTAETIVVQGEAVPEEQTQTVAASVYNDYKDKLNINAEAAWEISQGEGVTIAVIDTGIDYTHEDLTDNIWSNTAEIPENGVDDDGNGYIDDTRGWNFAGSDNNVYDEEQQEQEFHGTGIAGIIAAAKDNEIGIVGTAPKAKVMVLKVFKDGEAFTSDIIEAIQYAEEMGVKIVNCSFGSGGENRALEEAIKNSDMLFVCAAGNNSADLGETPIYPAAIESENIISVSSINKDGLLSAFSNYGDESVDVAAPGEEIYSTLPDNQYGYSSGTSMANAYVSAEAALLMGMEPLLSLDKIKQRIVECTDRFSSLAGKVSNGSKINCESALKNTVITDIIRIPLVPSQQERIETAIPESFTLLEIGETQTTKITAGVYHNLYQKEDGTVWAWGYNNYGQLGDGTWISKSMPVQISGMNHVAALAAGENHSFAIKEDGTVWAWGYNNYGQLGIGSTTSKNAPVQISGLSNVVAVKAGYAHSIALKSDGTVWSWGYNNYGQLGDGTTTNRYAPAQIIGLNNVVAIAAGYSHCLAVKNDGTIWSWGYNGYGQLGNGTTTSSSTPVQVSGQSNAMAVEAGAYYSIVIKNDGTLWAWGQNTSGQLGNGSSTNKSTAVQVNGMSNVAALETGYYHNVVLKADGTLWVWGSNSYGQLGNGNTTNKTSPIQINGVYNVAAAGGYHSIAMKEDGTVWTWGYNNYGQLGDGCELKRNDLEHVNGLSNILTVKASGNHNLAIKNDGTVWAWGHNNYGQLGDGTSITRNTPRQVSGLTNVMSTAAGHAHSMAIKNDGTVWAWGYNNYGQLGNGTTTNKNTPVKIEGLDDVVAVAAGYAHSVALKDDGSVWVWGYNNYGQLGNGTTINRTTPEKIDGLSNVIAIAAGYYHSLAVKADGTVWAWGYNGSGQLGDGTNTLRNAPVQVSGLNDIVAVASSYYHNVALGNDGTVWAWGYNYYGQLGIGSTVNKNKPVQVNGLNNVASVESGYYHCQAIKNDGTVWTWGRNLNGQLGVGTTTNSSTPIQIDSLEDISSISGGVEHTVVVDKHGIVYACGENAYCQLGDGIKLTYSAVPIDYMNDFLMETVKRTAVINAAEGKTFNLAITGIDLDRIYNRKYILNYDPSRIELVDLCANTPELETAVMDISSQCIQVTACSSGNIEFVVTDDSLEPGSLWSGSVNSIKFRSLINGQASINVKTR